MHLGCCKLSFVAPGVQLVALSFCEISQNISREVDKEDKQGKSKYLLTPHREVDKKEKWKLVKRLPGVSIISKNLVFYKWGYLRFEFFISRVNVVFYKKW